MKRLVVIALTVLLAACTPLAAAPPPSATSEPSSTARPTPRPTPSPSPSPSPTPEPTEPPPTVVRGQLARVMVDGARVRNAPGAATAASIVGRLAGGELVTILDGPVQVGAIRWWQVQVAGLTGWMPDRTGLAVSLLDAAEPAARDWNVWAATATSQLPASVADIPARVYVPNERDYTISVIDPATMSVIATLPAGILPEHVGPDWDLSRLYVSNYFSTELTVLDARSGALLTPITAPLAYNLYFTPDGSKAVVMAEEYSRIDFYDRRTWQLLRQLPIPFPGIDHADFSAGGRYLLATTEYAGVLVKVDTVTMEIVGSLWVGGSPVDVKLSPDGTVFYVANQFRHGVSIIDPVAMAEIGFLPTGRGAHGMAISRDTRWLYVTNRDAGSVSVIDFATRAIIATWWIGGSPDMLQVSTDGTQLWTANRRANTAVVLDAANGQVLYVIQVGRQPHGLMYFPQPGRFSLGHNGVYR
ncbi:MAG TPA: cytochrome D1 domain-containing protein [Candidatus Binatia bacterium]|nr:cytochrome D1 domain-containing protein [Candidatus Binatia bacterium]